MDEEDHLLSHQIQAVNRLAENFVDVYVITGKIGKYKSPHNVHVLSSQWKPGSTILNALRFLSIAIPFIIKKRPTSIFSHMTEVQTSLLAPFTKLLGIRHYLWYAHTHPSLYLRWAKFWITGIITSTRGSCPIKGPKVLAIGQAIDPKDYKFIKLDSSYSLNNLVHIGRFDPSKNIEQIIRCVQEFRKVNPRISLTLIGQPSTVAAKIQAAQTIKKYEEEVKAGWLNFRNSIPRSEVSAELLKYDCFVHAYIGSLDKTLIEATMVGLPIATINPEYLGEFGSWSKSSQVSLLQELDAINRESLEGLGSELFNRRKTCDERHSIAHWSESLMDILS